MTERSGPLAGIRVIELAAQGPLPLAATLLADNGAEVIRVDRPGGPRRADAASDVFGRSRQTIVLDLKDPRGVDALRELVANADVLLEGFRPGVLERMGLDPADLLAAHPSLVVGRMTGWGQDGPLALAAGHDINYLGLTGLLDAIGEPGRAPVPPLNLVADYGGGGMMLAFGVVCAVLRSRATAVGEIVDAAMIDGAAFLGSLFYGLAERGAWGDRGTNTIDGGAHFYRAYETSDGRWMSVGAIEPIFYAALLAVLGIDPDGAPQRDRTRWPELSATFAALFATRTQAQWVEAFDGVDACVAPVRTLKDAATHPHLAARGVLTRVDGHVQPAPVPRYASGVLDEPEAARPPGADTRRVLSGLGLSDERIDELVAAGVAGDAQEVGADV
ncbi:CaiB/BaiF CoA-transferase family protein [Microbacterium sp. zg-Y818]|uniref:CaiB/BaiF CoA transferase family protein n=1 Tax=unclassified Microbacterium TaxID=2609290 RepID=UPI00214AC847|nr:MULTISPECIES: CaiB/BaiF CoA-transferase family protein [unclassified Microbacterium]MCR2799307.1 CoA transferase [Microbacterium sp. zg.Y818]WIM21308.1 CaiB/BaiF CoA-transferase family protein [Microbacterium sp. zg-Y818]